MLCVLSEEIIWVEAAGNYVQIHTARKTHLVRHTVKAMEAKLDPQHFVRVRPSAIVARGAVEALNARHGGDYTVVVAGGTEIRSSRGFRERVERGLHDLPGSARKVLANRRRRRASRSAARAAAAEPTSRTAPRPGVTTPAAAPQAHAVA